MPERPVRPPRTARTPRGSESTDSSELPTKRWRRLVKPAALAAAVFVILLSPAWAPKILRHMDFFHVRHVEVVGTKYLDPAEILERLKVDTTASVWDVPDAMRQRVASHPLVKDVTIDRKLPGTLVVRIVEHA